MQTQPEEKMVASEVCKPDKDAQFKVCPQCGDKILAEGTRDECDECEVPYVLEK